MSDGPDDGARHDDASGRAEAFDAAISAHLEPWLRRIVARVATAHGLADDGLDAEAAAAAREAAATVLPRVHDLLRADIDRQSTTPLQLVRGAVAWPTAVLRAHRVPAAERDAFARERFPDDDYDLTPATLADLDPAVGEAAIAWGAAKAWEHRRRHSG
jgi:hypothetical protein